MSNILYVGIDVSSLTNVVYIMLPNGREYASFSVDNSLYGAKYIVKASIPRDSKKYILVLRQHLFMVKTLFTISTMMSL